jgi:hypothetical protein
MAAATTTPSRSIRRTICKCGVEFGQEYSVNTQEHESLWLPPCCPKCEEQLRVKLLAEEFERRADEHIVEHTVEIDAETDRRAAEDLERPERIRQAAAESMAQEVQKFYAARRVAFESFEEEQDWHRIAAQIIAEKRSKFLDEQLKKER